MEGSLQRRKAELAAECKVSSNLFTLAMQRLNRFLEPYLSSFGHHNQVAHARRVVEGLCSDLQHKNGESIAYHFGLDRKGIQHFIGESPWHDKPLREELARQVGRTLGTAEGVNAFDPSAFPKSGMHSVGVCRQWCGRQGKVDNCQVAVYMGYVSSKGHALVDTELYLPKEWTSDKQRLKRARVPKERHRFRTRHEICLELLERHGKRLPHRWISGDDELGRPAAFRQQLRQRKEAYVLAVPCNTTIRDLQIPAPEYCGNGRPAKRPSWRVDRWVAQCGEAEWSRIDVRDGEKGPMIVEALQRRVETGQRHRPSVAEELLVVIRYRERDRGVVKTDYYLSNANPVTPLSELCRVATAHHRVEECFQRGKGEVGLGDYEVRNWVGWHHHQTLSLLAAWFLTVETTRAEKKDACHDIPASTTGHRRDATSHAPMRFTPRRQTPNRTTSAPQPVGQALPLEKAQPATAQEFGTKTILGQSN